MDVKPPEMVTSLKIFSTKPYFDYEILCYEGRKQTRHFKWKVQFLLNQDYQEEFNKLYANALVKHMFLIDFI